MVHDSRPSPRDSATLVSLDVIVDLLRWCPVELRFPVDRTSDSSSTARIWLTGTVDGETVRSAHPPSLLHSPRSARDHIGGTRRTPHNRRTPPGPAGCQARLAQFPITSLYSSDISRAMETAEILADRLDGLRIQKTRLLREVNPTVMPWPVPRWMRRAGKAQIAAAYRRFFRPSRTTRHELLVGHGLDHPGPRNRGPGGAVDQVGGDTSVVQLWNHTIRDLPGRTRPDRELQRDRPPPSGTHHRGYSEAPAALSRRWCTTLRLRRGSCRLSGHGDRYGCTTST